MVSIFHKDAYGILSQKKNLSYLKIRRLKNSDFTSSHHMCEIYIYNIYILKAVQYMYIIYTYYILIFIFYIDYFCLEG